MADCEREYELSVFEDTTVAGFVKSVLTLRHFYALSLREFYEEKRYPLDKSGGPSLRLLHKSGMRIERFDHSLDDGTLMPDGVGFKVFVPVNHDPRIIRMAQERLFESFHKEVR